MKKISILLLSLLIAFSFIACKNEPVKPEEIIKNKIVGTGTAQDPYVIRSLEAFKQLGSEEWQTKIEKSESAETYYKLECDIDLSKEPSGRYFINAFGGVLDGNGHTIKGNNGIRYFFNYIFADTTIKNLNITFDTESITRLWYQTSIKGTIVSGTSENDIKVAYDKDKMTFNLENVDFVSGSDYSYFIGDNNAGIYQLNAPTFITVFSGNEYKDFCFENAYKDETPLKYTITLKNCDVNGNYNGGFGNSGAAVFLGGQLEGVDIVLEGCTFNGILEGYNVAFLMGNNANCIKSTITLNNVQNKGRISSYTDKGSLLYGNGKTSDATVKGTISGNEINQINPTLTLTKPVKNAAFDFSTLSEGSYELKLFLPSVYTYDGDSYQYQTNSNTITVPVTKETKDFFLAKVLSSNDQKAETLTLADWKTVETATKEGAKYQFVDIETDKYLVINYGTTVKKLYTKNDKGNTVEPAYMKQAMLLLRDTSGKINSVSMLVSL